MKLHEANKCACDLKLLTKYIAGVAGTGKSFLIEAIKLLVAHMWPTGDLTAVVAPTGTAAFNVSGLTIHRLFQLPIKHEGKTANYWPLSRDAQKVMRTTLHSVKPGSQYFACVALRPEVHIN